MFSTLSQKLHGESNALYKLREELKGQGCVLQDLISGNINDQGFLYPQDLLEEMLVRGSRQCQIYRPDSFGQRCAREAVAQFYQTNGCSLDPDCVLITPGSSLSYWYCFRLLADEGDEVLCPCPSYPLFDYIAMLSGVRLIPYRLEERRNWAIDIEQLEACISTKTRAIALISPHNPTGAIASPEDIAAIADIARRHNLAIISDEVFSEFLIGPKSLPRPIGSEAPLVFTLNGFSKMFALPGVKFGWMAVSGDREKVRHAMRALELISDTFLPVNEIIQASAPEIFRQGRSVCHNFADRIRDCWELTENALVSSQSIQYARPAGGFYVTLRLENLEEESAAEAILRESHLVIHPGYFYDMAPNHLILCFVQKPETLRASLPKLTATLEKLSGRCGGI
jgi:alanine-synthesizing transaminase